MNKPTSAGLHHTAFEYANFGQWLDNDTRLRDHGITPFMCLDHGITMSMYYADPEGNGVEIQFDAFGDWAESKEWIWASREFAENPIGEWFDPDKLVEAREQGLPREEIHEGARAGKYRPENPAGRHPAARGLLRRALEDVRLGDLTTEAGAGQRHVTRPTRADRQHVLRSRPPLRLLGCVLRMTSFHFSARSRRTRPGAGCGSTGCR